MKTKHVEWCTGVALLVAIVFVMLEGINKLHRHWRPDLACCGRQYDEADDRGHLELFRERVP